MIHRALWHASCQHKAAKASGCGRQSQPTETQHHAAGPHRRPAARVFARGRPMLCWQPFVGPPRKACSTIAESTPPRLLRGWLVGPDGPSVAPVAEEAACPLVPPAVFLRDVDGELLQTSMRTSSRLTCSPLRVSYGKRLHWSRRFAHCHIPIWR